MPVNAPLRDRRMTWSQLKISRVRDVYRLAKWLQLDADKRTGESVRDYYRRLLTSVWEAVKGAS